LKEFLELMQPASKLKTMAKSMDDDHMMEPPTKVQALEIPEGESDGEYEAVPKRSRKKSPSKVAAAAGPPPAAIGQPMASEEPMVEPIAPNATDDDWLRSRTNRLLDLMDPEDIVAGKNAESTSQNIEPVAEIKVNVDAPVSSDDKPAEETFENEEEGKPDAIIEEIKKTGRLFVRNLLYSASEDDLRRHFEPFGPLEEVRISPFSPFIPLPFHDEYPDRDSLCFKHVM